MPSQLMSHSTLYIGKVKTVSPLFFLPFQTFADYHQDRQAGRLWKDSPHIVPRPRPLSRKKPKFYLSRYYTTSYVVAARPRRPKPLPHNNLRIYSIVYLVTYGSHCRLTIQNI